MTTNRIARMEDTQNKLLSALSESTREELHSLESVPLQIGMILQEPDEDIEHVYFIEHGLVSLLSVSSEGSSIEIGLVGCEGMVGLPVVLGGFSPYRAVVQIQGSAWRMPQGHMADHFESNPNVRDILLKYTNSFLVQVAQGSICNCFHTLQERLSRWLLVARDAACSDQLKVTHDVIARLLGTRRASVTVTLGLLQKAELIRMSRGTITIVNLKGLEEIACECYDIVRESVRRVRN
jgi:CRP-like cAMP-binding protein